MLKVEKIANGYVVSFMNTDNVRVKVYFPTFDNMCQWMKNQFEPASIEPNKG